MLWGCGAVQLVMTVGLLAVVVYLYTVVAFNFFRKFYNKSEDEDEPDMKCDDMMTVGGRGGARGGLGGLWGAVGGFGGPWDIWGSWVLLG